MSKKRPLCEIHGNCNCEKNKHYNNNYLLRYEKLTVNRIPYIFILHINIVFEI